MDGGAADQRAPVGALALVQALLAAALLGSGRYELLAVAEAVWPNRRYGAPEAGSRLRGARLPGSVVGVRSCFVDLVELVWCFGQGVGVSEDSGLVRASMVDGSTFEVLFDRHHASVWAFLARSAGRQAADDLAGQVFVIAFERRASFDPALGEVRGWLIGIARNLARSQQRNDERGWRAVQRLARQREDWVDQFEDVVDTDELRREHAKVLEAIGRLAQDDRELLTMAVWDRLTYPEIATALEVPVGTVRSRLSRARQRLRELVVESGQEQVVDLQQDRPT